MDQVFRRIVHHVTPGVVRLIANVRGTWLMIVNWEPRGPEIGGKLEQGAYD